MNRQQRRILTGIVAILAGMAVCFIGDQLLGVYVELWLGISTFDTNWILAMFLVPFISGIVVSVLYGLGGKWLCYLPPIFVRVITYFSLATGVFQVPDGAELLTFPLWVLIVILAFEAAAFGGVAGEILVKKTYGRHPERILYQGDKEDATDGTDTEQQK